MNTLSTFLNLLAVSSFVLGIYGWLDSGRKMAKLSEIYGGNLTTTKSCQPDDYEKIETEAKTSFSVAYVSLLWIIAWLVS